MDPFFFSPCDASPPPPPYSSCAVAPTVDGRDGDLSYPPPYSVTQINDHSPYNSRSDYERREINLLDCYHFVRGITPQAAAVRAFDRYLPTPPPTPPRPDSDLDRQERLHHLIRCIFIHIPEIKKIVRAGLAAALRAALKNRPQT